MSSNSQHDTYTPPPLLEGDPQRRENRIPGWYRFFIGDIEATVISDGRLRPPTPEELFPLVPKETLYSILRSQYLPTAGLIMEQNCLAIRLDDKYVLFDTGIGFDRESGSEESGRLLANMEAAGIDRQNVAAVILTHAHNDHCWGLVDADGQLNFPNAEIFVSRSDFDFWTDERLLAVEGYRRSFAIGARRNLLPYRKQLNFVTDGTETVSGVTAISSPGHSIGHTSYIISSANEDHLFLGDIAHSTALQLQNPDWEFFYDFDPAQAARTRRRVLDRAISENLTLIGYHFAFPGVGHIRREGQSYSYFPAPILHK